MLNGIRKLSGTVPVLVLSGYDAPEDVNAYMRGGACAFLSKSNGLSPVLTEIDRLLGVRRKTGSRPVGTDRRPAVRTDGSSGGRDGRLLLIADDDENIRTVLRRYLSSMFHEIIETGDGDKTLELSRARKPDLVLLDINMPARSGVSVLRELVPEMPETGFMMITGNEDEDVARECLNSGAFDYISKPIKLDALATTIKAWLFLRR